MAENENAVSPSLLIIEEVIGVPPIVPAELRELRLRWATRKLLEEIEEEGASPLESSVRTQRERVAMATIEHVAALMDRKEPSPEGRWLWIEILGKPTLEDIWSSGDLSVWELVLAGFDTGDFRQTAFDVVEALVNRLAEYDPHRCSRCAEAQP